ncbi:hypothetical protein GALMADRAFT_1353334 [Galerina marginata CBS 339.88]|uniref:Uncharacterized protein n=1 Tax=Galerina marginata (strain CBS 339.88) TaxID=685588 RepID=A0A067SFZ5_GALM3|nr:hypothetical protein GALMADRAFT_1353334 [Galerina marginata CBS 339.88]
MPKNYHLVDQDEDGNTPYFLNPPSHASPNTFVISKRIALFFVAITLLNVILAGANAYYSAQLTGLLRKYEYKDISSLPLIDPFTGGYISTSKSILDINPIPPLRR